MFPFWPDWFTCFLSWSWPSGNSPSLQSRLASGRIACPTRIQCAGIPQYRLTFSWEWWRFFILHRSVWGLRNRVPWWEWFSCFELRCIWQSIWLCQRCRWKFRIIFRNWGTWTWWFCFRSKCQRVTILLRPNGITCTDSYRYRFLNHKGKVPKNPIRLILTPKC